MGAIVIESGDAFCDCLFFRDKRSKGEGRRLGRCR